MKTTNCATRCGTKIGKTRPALIISPTDFNLVRSKITLLPISSTAVRAKKIAPVVVRVAASSELDFIHFERKVKLNNDTLDLLHEYEISSFQRLVLILEFADVKKHLSIYKIIRARGL